MEAIDRLLEGDVLALHCRQVLEPVDGRDGPVYPPTYPPERKGGPHIDNTPYTVNRLADGTTTAVLDSVPSQANRMERCFGWKGRLRESVPVVAVQVSGAATTCVADLGHRIADAVIRSTELAGEIEAAFDAYAAGDPLPMATLAPTALLYGAWDSRATRVKVPRLVRSEVLAHDVDVCVRAAQFQGSFTQEQLGFNAKEWDKGASSGFAPTPAVDKADARAGGVIARGQIVQSTVLHVGAMVDLGPEGGAALPRYLLCLALAALLDDRGGSDYTLRSGCWLAPDGGREATLVTRRGDRETFDLDGDAVRGALADAVTEATTALKIPCGVHRVVKFDPARARTLLNAKVKGEDA